MDHELKELLPCDSPVWDRRIAADLSAEFERQISDKISTLPEMRRFLAVKGYRELTRRIEASVQGHSGPDAVRALAIAMRAYALERPGLSAATFRTPLTETDEWRAASGELAERVLAVFSGIGITGVKAQHALRALRSLVRGFVIFEMSSAFLEPLAYDESYLVAVDIFVAGLVTLQSINAAA